MLLAFAAPFTAHAAEKMEVYDSYANKNSNVQLYSVSQVEGNQFINAVIARQPDGTYSKWPEAFSTFPEV
ncbi:hypothetical protein ACFTAO_30395 [Paenibacillus rhizoplanae]